MNGTIISDLNSIPNDPIVAFIEGDGIGVDITPAMIKVVDAAVNKAYQGKRKVFWQEVYAGEKANKKFGEYLPAATLEAIKKHKVAIKGPMTTPVGGGMRSLNVALRQQLDLYVCLRPITYFEGVPSPLKNPEKTNMVIFRENTEDIYSGIEWSFDSEAAKQLISILQEKFAVNKIRFPQTSAIGIKNISQEGSERLIRASIEYAITHKKPSVTLVHKGNIMKYTEGGFKEWGYNLAKKEFGAQVQEDGTCTLPQGIIIKDVIADAFLQQILLMPQEFSVIATTNLNGDYISDALAAQVGGIGIAPGANLSKNYAIFEATHGTAPKHAGLDRANPSSLILSAEMMLRHFNWHQAADLIIKGLKTTILAKTVTYDFHRSMANATLLSCSKFAEAIVNNMA